MHRLQTAMAEPLLYRTPDPQAKDLRHLKLLAIGHYVWGGLLLLGGFAAIEGMFEQAPKVGDALGTTIAYLSIGCVALFYWGVGTLTLISGRCLQILRWQMFSLVVAAIHLFLVPLGTILALFTLIIASRQSISRMYEVNRRPSRRSV